MKVVSLLLKNHRCSRCLVSMLTIMALVLSSVVLPVHTKKSSAAENTSSYGLSNPTISNDVTTWDCIYFGNYWQNDTNGDGKADENDKKQPIKWRVLSVDGNDAFLLADQNLYTMTNDGEYDVETGTSDETWAACASRTWLNDTFLNTAFTSAEQAAIKNTTVVNDDNPYCGTEGGVDTIDKVYLLSISEASNTAYGFNGEFGVRSETRVATNTAYVAGKDLGFEEDSISAAGEADYWWLRSPGNNSRFPCTGVSQSLCKPSN